MHRYLFLTLLAAASAITLPGPCPPLHAMENFDLARYQGKWYEMARYPNVAEAGAKGKCTTAEYVIFGDVGKLKKTHVVDGVKSYIQGAITHVGPSKIRFTFTFGDRFKDQYLNILKTDYDNYSIGYNCRNNPENNTHEVFSWIKSRAPIMNPSSMTIVNNYVQTSPLLEADKYIANDHSPSTCASTYEYEITEFLD